MSVLLLRQVQVQRLQRCIGSLLWGELSVEAGSGLLNDHAADNPVGGGRCGQLICPGLKLLPQFCFGIVEIEGHNISLVITHGSRRIRSTVLRDLSIKGSLVHREAEALGAALGLLT